MAQLLHELHENNTFHGDIRPSNIFVIKKDKSLKFFIFGNFGNDRATAIKNIVFRLKNKIDTEYIAPKFKKGE